MMIGRLTPYKQSEVYQKIRKQRLEGVTREEFLQNSTNDGVTLEENLQCSTNEGVTPILIEERYNYDRNQI